MPNCNVGDVSDSLPRMSAGSRRLSMRGPSFYGPRGRLLGLLFFAASLNDQKTRVRYLQLVGTLSHDRFRPIITLTRSKNDCRTTLTSSIPICNLGPTKISSDPLDVIQTVTPLHHLVRTRRPSIIYTFLSRTGLTTVTTYQKLPRHPGLLIYARGSPLDRCRHP